MALFNRVTICTPESVELEFDLAGIGSRAWALIIDYHILGACVVAFWLIWALFSSQFLRYLSQLNINYSDAPIWLLAIAFLVTALLFASYFVVFEVLRQGQTPGKRWAKIRVIRDNGRPVGLSQAALRALLRPIDDFLFLGAILIFVGKREKRIGDWVAGTLVVQDAGVRAGAIATSTTAQTLAQQLPQLADLTQLLPDDFAVIRDYLQRRTEMATQARSDLSLQLARQARTIIQLETIPDGLTSDQFLEALYLAYQERFSV